MAVLNAGVTELTDGIKLNLTASPAPLLSGPFLFQMFNGFHSKITLNATSPCVSNQSTILSTKDLCIFSPHLFAFYVVNHRVTVGVTDGYLILSGYICISTFQLSALLPDKQSQCS